jgi:hypothetical protein
MYKNKFHFANTEIAALAIDLVVLAYDLVTIS